MKMARDRLYSGRRPGHVVEAAILCGATEPVKHAEEPLPRPTSPRAAGGSRAIAASSEGRPVDTVITAAGRSATRGWSDRRGSCAPGPGWAPGILRETRWRAILPGGSCCALRSDRPKQPTKSLRASVSSDRSAQGPRLGSVPTNSLSCRSERPRGPTTDGSSPGARASASTASAAGGTSSEFRCRPRGRASQSRRYPRKWLGIRLSAIPE